MPAAPAAAPAPTPFDTQPYAEGPLPASTRIFLIAGGDDIANFAQEVATQRRLWAHAGAPEDSIACYWAKPDANAWRADRRQYRALQTQVQDCRRADPTTVRRDLLRVASERPEWIYVFVTSHGLPPILRWHAETEDPAEAAARLQVDPKELAALDHHAIGLQAGPGPRLEAIPEIVAGYRAGVEVGDLMLSPSTLAQTLSQLPASTLKIVVLQACFSGGFIGETGEGGQLSALTEVPNVVLLTATAHDRPSFGCGAGQVTTYYGGAINKALARRLEPGTSPARMPWETIWEDAAFVVDVMESIDGERPSAPAFFSNVGDRVTIR